MIFWLLEQPAGADALNTLDMAIFVPRDVALFVASFGRPKPSEELHAQQGEYKREGEDQDGEVPQLWDHSHECGEGHIERLPIM